MSQQNSVRIRSKFVLEGIVVLLLTICAAKLTQAQSESSSSAQLHGNAATPAEISMDFKDANVKDILKIFSQQSGLNFIASEKVKDRKLTLYLDKVSVEDALNTIMSANKLNYELKKDSNIFVVKEDDQPEIVTITKIFPLKHAWVPGYGASDDTSNTDTSNTDTSNTDTSSTDTSSTDTSSTDTSSTDTKKGIKEVVEKLLSKQGTVIQDSRTNSLIVTDIPSQFTEIEKAIEALDTILPQVMIEVEVVETSMEAIDKLGMEWGGSQGELASVAGAKRSLTYPFTRDVSVTDTEDGAFKAYGYISAENLKATLSLLDKNTDTRILARPKVLALNGEEALIDISAKYPYIDQTTVSSDGTATEAVEFSDIGTVLRVTPWISPKGLITMYVKPKVTSLLSVVPISATKNAPYTNIKEADVKVCVKDGETVIIGGLIDNQSTKILRKVPFLGDIPVLGYFFQKKDDTTTDKELIIFITPHICKDTQTPKQQEQAKATTEAEPVTEHKEDEIEKILDSLEE